MLGDLKNAAVHSLAKLLARSSMYNNSCAEMRSEARDSFIRMYMINN